MTEIPGMVERVRRELDPYLQETLTMQDREDAAGAAIAAHEAALRDAGMVIVPREPTEEMLSAGNALVLAAGTASGCYQDHNPAPADAWQAMVAAAHRCQILGMPVVVDDSLPPGTFRIIADKSK